jgi:mycothiol S-conjugate amidase
MPRTILALHAHPDDESSKGAATVARLVDEGVRAVLVTATGGEAGDILNPEMDRPEVRSRLAEIRARELEEAAGIIGYDEVVMLGFRDSGMPDSHDNVREDAFCNQPFEVVLERVVEVVRRVRPDVVLGYDAHEFYPHPDHLRIHEISMEIVAAAADASRFPLSGDPWLIQKLYAPIFTADRILALHEAMLESEGESPFAMWIERGVGADDYERTVLKFDVSGYVDRGKAALLTHRTQVDPAGFWFAVPTAVIESIYPWEDFELLYSNGSSMAAETHLFAGIDE